MIEGVGYVKLNGENQSAFHNGKYEKQDGCVNVEVETDLNRMVDFDIYYTENLMEEVVALRLTSGGFASGRQQRL